MEPLWIWQHTWTWCTDASGTVLCSLSPRHLNRVSHLHQCCLYRFLKTLLFIIKDCLIVSRFILNTADRDREKQTVFVQYSTRMRRWCTLLDLWRFLFLPPYICPALKKPVACFTSHTSHLGLLLLLLCRKRPIIQECLVPWYFSTSLGGLLTLHTLLLSIIKETGGGFPSTFAVSFNYPFISDVRSSDCWVKMGLSRTSS